MSEIEAYKKMIELGFDHIDRDHSGKITRKEASDFLLTFGFRDIDVDEFMRPYDQNKDKKISKDEYQEMVHKINASRVTEAQLRREFQIADRDKSGKVSAAELRHYLEKHKNLVTEKQVDAWIQENDKNHDGKLNYNEFLNFMRQKL
ncbi:unnamed protein product [Calicophoron daubneyi]|uniref:EF-hand domain-containing protein n=1 Tax=Calicophoron daubneyi TaxID=300641 RepID=A0AAV2TT40_CALDB